MTRVVVLGLLLLAAGCSSATGEDRARVVRTAVDSARLGCQIYQRDLSIPRDPAVTEFCERTECKP